MTKVKMWKVIFAPSNRPFNSYDEIDVVARNVKHAIEEAQKIRRGQMHNRIQNVTEVELLVTAD